MSRSSVVGSGTGQVSILLDALLIESQFGLSWAQNYCLSIERRSKTRNELGLEVQTSCRYGHTVSTVYICCAASQLISCPAFLNEEFSEQFIWFKTSFFWSHISQQQKYEQNVCFCVEICFVVLCVRLMTQTSNTSNSYCCRLCQQLINKLVILRPIYW